jgi:hypothetical protein
MTTSFAQILANSNLMEPKTKVHAPPQEIVDALLWYDTSHHESQSACRAILGLASAILAKDCPRWLSLLGKSGVGKTSLAKTFAKWAQPRQPQQVLWTWARICDRCAQGDWGIMEQLRTQRILVLDDIFRPYDFPLTGASAFDRKTFRALGTLLNERVGRWTVITDNGLRREIASRDIPIASRLSREESVIVEFTCAPDYCATTAKPRSDTLRPE